MRSKVRLVASPAPPGHLRSDLWPAPALPSPRRVTPTLPLLPSHPNLKMPGAARSAQPPAYATMGVI